MQILAPAMSAAAAAWMFGTMPPDLSILLSPHSPPAPSPGGVLDADEQACATPVADLMHQQLRMLQMHSTQLEEIRSDAACHCDTPVIMQASCVACLS